MRLHSLQYLRAFAALAVVYSHTALQVDAYKPHLPYEGDWGVDIFFVISGFIMVYIAKPTDTPAHFMAHRIRRVVPLYWFFTLLMAAILFFLPSLFKNTTFSLVPTIQSLLFIPHWSQAEAGRVWPILAPGWSLVYEMYFYLMFALSLLAPPRWRAPALMLSITVIYFLVGQIDSDAAWQTFLSEVTIFEFVFGMLLALAFHSGRLQISNTAAWLLLLISALWLIWQPDVPHLLRISVPALLLVTGTLFVQLPVSRFGLLLGDASYALYLSHLFVLGAARVVLPPIVGYNATGAWLFTLVSVIACILVSLFVHRWIDNGLLRHERLDVFKPFARRLKRQELT